MANLLQLQNGAKSFGGRQIFSNASVSVNEDEHIGVIGPNGAGKTTFFKILCNELELDQGEIVKSRQLRMGYVAQHEEGTEDLTIEDYVSRQSPTPSWELRQLGLDLGLSNELFSKTLRSLSGGYRMRAKLLRLLGQKPNLMLLDEPTNYLDLETLIVLEKFLQDFSGAFLLISHDREFLRRTTDHIIEIENGDFVKYSGNIDDYFEQKMLLRSQLEKRALSLDAKRKEILDFAARFGAKASKARQAQSRLKSLSKMETIEIKALPVAATIRIPPPVRTGRIALELEGLDLGYPERVILSDVNLRIETGQKIGVVGFNGAGKSTLLRSLAGDLPCLSGDVGRGHGVDVAYYAQHVSERLISEHTVLQSLQSAAHREVSQQAVLDLAGSLLFSGEAMKKKIAVLSGGERARVALGQMLLKKSPVLLLDEPTNHLDFYTVEALTQALSQYAGTVVLVSHDRGFIRRVCSQILEIKRGRVNLYPGTYDEYVWSVQSRSNSDDSEEPPPPTRPRPKLELKSVPLNSEKDRLPNAALKNQIKELEQKRREQEKLITEIDKKIRILESRVREQSEQLAKLSGPQAADLAREIGLSQKKIEELEGQSLAALEAQEALRLEIESLRA